MSDEITELEELDAQKVSGVGAPANGTPFLLLKAQEPHETDTDSEEADQIGDEVTGSDVGEDDSMDGDAEKGKLKAKQRKKLPKSDFALPAKAPESGSYPIPDESHARNALARVSQFGTPEEKRKVRAAVRRKFPQIDQAKKSPGVPDFATQTPMEGGAFPTDPAGLRGPETGAVLHPHADPSYSLGGQSSYEIPAEARAFPVRNPPAPGRENRPAGSEAAPGAKATAVVVTSLMEAMEQIEAMRSLEKKGKAVSMPNPQGAAASQIGSGPWEDYDSASLGSIAQVLASAGRAIDAIQHREAVEAANGNAGDIADTMDLGDAEAALDAALGIVARLAYHEGAAGQALAQKAGRVLSRKNEDHLRQARDHLSQVLGGLGDQEGPDHGQSEENEIMTTVTKEELASMVAEASAKAAKAQAKAERKAAIKAAKKQAKKEAKARKNANNGGDITAEQEQAGEGGEVDAFMSVPGGNHADPQYTNENQVPAAKKSEKRVLAELKAANAQLQSLQEKVTKMASRPRAGGPVLDGRAHGAMPALEHRMYDPLTKASDSDIEKLRTELSEAMQKSGPEAAARVSDISQALTLIALRREAAGQPIPPGF